MTTDASSPVPNTDYASLWQRKVIVEVVEHPLSAPEWWAMDEKGFIRDFKNPAQVVAWIKRRDAASARRGRSTVTTVEWRNVPKGFVPPEVQQ